MAIEHDSIPAGEIHEPKGITSATANQVYISNGVGGGTWTNQVGGGNTVNVKAATDFPAAISGVITLADNTTYVVSGEVTITDTITPGTLSSIVGLEATNNALTYTGNGNMFEGTNKSFYVTNLALDCPSGTLHNFTDSSPMKESVIEYNGVIVRSASVLGACNNIKQLRFFECVISDIITTGMTFSGDIEQIFSVDTDYVNNSASPVYNLGTTTVDLMWHLDFQCELNNASGSFISGLASSGNINAGGSGELILGRFVGAGTPLVGITVDDVRWFFDNLNTVQSTIEDAVTFLKNNTVDTVISAVNTPTLVAGTWAEHRASHFTTDVNGRVTYIGERDIVIPISVTITATMSSGNDKNITFYIAKNGTVIANSGMSNVVKSAGKGNTTLLWQELLQPNDYIEVWVENNDDAIDILVEDLNFIVN